MWKKFLYLFGIPFVLFGVVGEARAACDQTLSTGANIASAVSSAAAGSTICLNSGNYGSVTISNITKSSNVTIRSSTSKGATVTFTVRNSNHLVFNDMTFAGGDVCDPGELNHDLQFTNNAFTNHFKVCGGGGLSPSTDVHILIDGNTFTNIPNEGGIEGRLQGYDMMGVTISNNIFNNTNTSGANCTDGIQTGGNGGTIGPGNTFTGLVQGGCGPHIDSIQLWSSNPVPSNVTIIGNYFDKDTMYIGAYDGSASILVKDNVFGPGDSNTHGLPLQFGAVNGFNVLHNTFKGGWSLAQGTKAGMTPTHNATYKDNIFAGTRINDAGDQPGCSSGCVYDHNLYTSSSDVHAGDTNTIIGTPTFTGGSNPSTWAGYQLTSSSLGYHNASDGQDRGTTYYGSGTVNPPPPDTTPPTAPTNLAANVTLGAQVDLTWTASVDAVGVALYQVER
ncbi:MAG: hypothetical protein PHT88_05510, partial [Candidatus Moranbacteria bacterium]|nr:hypothetical protein [Candidatus Moranbacteria bacterium]